MKSATVYLALLCLTSAIVSVSCSFWDDFYKNFGLLNYNNDVVQLNLYRSPQGYKIGSGFQSKRPYLYGYISMNIKLVPGNSAGTVTSYFLSSTYKKHCEVDFEFLGNVSGQPYALQTNVFAEGVGEREQRILLWFDPAAEFHTYSILWNRDLILFLVDGKPIRVYHNVAMSLHVPYLDYQEMFVYSSIWDASSWATRGGLDKADWSKAPFKATYKDFHLEACAVNGVTTKHDCYKKLYRSPYGSRANQTLTTTQWADLKWIQKNYLIYDYCTDSNRWTKQPAECVRNWPQY